jgi:MFS family permease
MPEDSGIGKNPDGLKLFGMPAEKGRWVFVILGLLINLCMGTIYAWSVFRKPLEKVFAIGATESLLPYIVFLALFALLMPFAGGPLDRYGPKKMTILGGILLGVGWILGSLSTSILMLVLTYGVIGGAGVGIIYNCPIGVVGRWFPDKRGLAVGATVLGFGVSALFTAPLANSLITSRGVLPTFMYLGIAFLILIVLMGLPLKFPPQDWKPSGWTQTATTSQSCCELNRSEMVRTKSFWGLWLCFFIGTLIGLMVIGISSSVGQEMFLLSSGLSAMLVGIFSLFNGIGRPLFGYLFDKLAIQRAAILSFGIIFCAAVILALGSGSGSAVIYIIGFSALWLCLGSWLAIAPACTGTFWGTKYYGPNYGLVFTAYGAGAIAGNLLAGRMRDIFGSYNGVFIPMALLAVVGVIITLTMLRPPVPKPAG